MQNFVLSMLKILFLNIHKKFKNSTSLKKFIIIMEDGQNFVLSMLKILFWSIQKKIKNSMSLKKFIIVEDGF